MAQHQQWEYRTVDDPTAALRDALGREGWELAGTAGGDPPRLLLFKRPCPTFQEQVTLGQK